MRKQIFSLVFVFLLTISVVNAVDLNIRPDAVDTSHAIWITNISIDPDYLSQGGEGKLELTLKNVDDESLRDLRIDLGLPTGVNFFNDVSVKKIEILPAGMSQKVSFDIIVAPSTSEGVYEGNITIDYITPRGYSRQDSYDFGMIIKSTPELFVQIEDSEVYKGSNIGEITVKFVNNDLADVKFMTVEIEETDDFEVISSKKQYIGDLDSDDFDSIDFKINVKSSKNVIMVPLKMDYKDTLNNDYSEAVEVELVMRSGAELGIQKNNTTLIVIGVIIVIGVVWYFYRRYKKKKKKQEKF